MFDLHLICFAERPSEEERKNEKERNATNEQQAQVLFACALARNWSQRVGRYLRVVMSLSGWIEGNFRSDYDSCLPDGPIWLFSNNVVPFDITNAGILSRTEIAPTERRTLPISGFGSRPERMERTTASP